MKCTLSGQAILDSPTVHQRGAIVYYSIFVYWKIELSTLHYAE
jgi:hypothetical protein